MPRMSTLLEGLVTTLLSLDYLNQQPEAPLPYRSQSLQSVPSRCRSNSLSSSSSSESESDTTGRRSSSSELSPSKAIYQYHCPPCETMTYDNNDTVFGAILRGDLPAVTLHESDRFLALEDIKPRAPLHALIIPKAFVGSVFDIDGVEDTEWVQEMHQMALDLVKTHHPEAHAANDYRLCFHIPPFNSVDHLHLHVLAPLSKMNFFYRHIKYNPRTRWCINSEQVLERLQGGESAVHYRRPPTCKSQKEAMGITGKRASGSSEALKEGTAEGTESNTLPESKNKK